jgi:hypothetical protein
MAGSYWEEFERLLETECGVPVGEVGPFLTRRMRSGAYQAFNVWGGDFAKPGATTPVFDDIAELLEAGTS